jgi:predicted phosphodiesterase
MNVLSISDIHWEHPDKDVLDQFRQDIKDYDPGLVLFCGDVINDGGNKNEHLEEFEEMLDILENLEINSLVIKGNHDEYSDYESLVSYIEDLEFSKEISNETTTIKGLKIAGISFSYTNDIKKARNIKNRFNDSYDIVMAHAENKRRIWLFEINTDYIITGHYDQRLCMVDNKVFVSLSSYTRQKCLLQTDKEELKYIRSSKFTKKSENFISKVKIHDNKFDWKKYEEDDRLINKQRNERYSEMILEMINTKEVIDSLDHSEQKERINNLRKLGAYKTHIREYIKDFDFL